MAYIKTAWVNDSTPAISSENLNKIEQGIYDAHSDISTLTDVTEELVVISPNIVQLNTATETSLGITVSYDGNTININGTSNAGGNIWLCPNTSFLVSNQNYTFSVRKVSGSFTGSSNVSDLGVYTRNTATLLGSVLDVKTIDTNGMAKMTFSGDVKATQYVRLNIAGANVGFSNLKLEIQLEKGTYATDFHNFGEYIINENGLLYSDDYISYLDTQLNKYERGKTFRVCVATDLHCGSDCGGKYNNVWQDSAEFIGATYQERMKIFVDSVNKENRENPIDMLIITGDVSVNGANQGLEPMVFLEEFLRDYAPQLDVPVFYLPGNHDPYANDDWKSVIGYNREFSIETDDYYFICLDSFKATTTGTEVSYTGFDSDSTDFFLAEVAKAGNKKIFVCSHYFDETDGNTTFWNEFYTNPNIIGRLEGHAHMFLNGWTNKTIDGVTYTKYRANSGGFIYPTTKWEDGISNNSNLWGFRIIEIDADNSKLYTWEVQPAHYYPGIDVDMPYTPVSNKSSMGAVTKNKKATFFVPSMYRSDDRLTRAIADLQNRVTILEQG